MHDPIMPATPFERLMPPDAVDPASVGKPVRRITSTATLTHLRQFPLPSRRGMPNVYHDGRLEKLMFFSSDLTWDFLVKVIEYSNARINHQLALMREETDRITK